MRTFLVVYRQTECNLNIPVAESFLGIEKYKINFFIRMILILVKISLISEAENHPILPLVPTGSDRLEWNRLTIPM